MNGQHGSKSHPVSTHRLAPTKKAGVCLSNQFFGVQGVDVVPATQTNDLHVVTNNTWWSTLHEPVKGLTGTQVTTPTHMLYRQVLSNNLRCSALQESVKGIGGTQMTGRAYTIIPGVNIAITPSPYDHIEVRAGASVVTAGIGTTRIIKNVNEGALFDLVSAIASLDESIKLFIATPIAERRRLKTVSDNFEFRDRIEVMRFLDENKFLVDLILESQEKIKNEFEESARLILEVVKDPEFDSDKELFLIIKTALSAEAALSSLEKLDQNWWLEASGKAKCKLNIDYELA